MEPLIFDIPEDPKSIIKVIGVGGGGSNAVNHMFKNGIEGVDFAVCNTDNQSLEMSPIPTKIQLGPELTDGRGAGSKPEIGKKACEESIEHVRTFLEKDTKMLFVTAGMGGGTGTGAAPVIAKTAQDMDILTVGIVTLPFIFEGRKRLRHGLEGLEQLKKHVDTLILISNDKLNEIYGNLSLSQAFSKADDVLTMAAKGIAEIITVPGKVNVDFEDVNTVMRSSGAAIMGSASAEGENRAMEAVDQALSSPLLEDNDIKGAKHILLNITSGTKEVTMEEIYHITEFIQEEAGKGTDLIWGHCQDETLEEKLSITIIATGFVNDDDEIDESVTETRVVLDLDGNEQPGYRPQAARKVFDDYSPESRKEDMPRPGSLTAADEQREAFLLQTNMFEDNEKSAEVTRRELERQRLVSERKERLKDISERPLSDIENVVELENQPAYLRQRVKLDDVKMTTAKPNFSTMVVNSNNEVEFTKNTFLHDNVD